MRYECGSGEICSFWVLCLGLREKLGLLDEDCGFDFRVLIHEEVEDNEEGWEMNQKMRLI